MNIEINLSNKIDFNQFKLVKSYEISFEIFLFHYIFYYFLAIFKK